MAKTAPINANPALPMPMLTAAPLVGVADAEAEVEEEEAALVLEVTSLVDERTTDEEELRMAVVPLLTATEVERVATAAELVVTAATVVVGATEMAEVSEGRTRVELADSTGVVATLWD